MARDPNFYPDPLRFDGRRFYNVGKSLESQDRSDHEFAGIDPWNVHWGSGRFTCPGRWYASAVIKMFIASILLRYDIKFPMGQKQRPENSYLDVGIVPNSKQKILLKLR